MKASASSRTIATIGIDIGKNTFHLVGRNGGRWLTLADSEISFVRNKVEVHVAPEIVDARDPTRKVMKEAQQGWQKALAKIGERAGLSKGSDGTWGDPSIRQAACFIGRHSDSFRQSLMSATGT